MTTLTITDAKKNLTKWLKVAASGGEVAIVCGADIVALRKVAVQAADHVGLGYKINRDRVAADNRKAGAEHEPLKKKSGKAAGIRTRPEPVASGRGNGGEWRPPTSSRVGWKGLNAEQLRAAKAPTYTVKERLWKRQGATQND